MAELDFHRSSREARGDAPTERKPSPRPTPKKTYKLVSKSFPARNVGPSEGPHLGTGTFTITDKHLVEPWTVGRDFKAPLSTQLGFRTPECKIRVMSFEIDTVEAPNWFGVSFRQGIRALDSVNIFCHPFPEKAQMHDQDYAGRSGNWPRLFRYAQMFGSQMAAATSNLVTIVPFFNNATYGNTGIFGPNWQDFVAQILAAVRQDAAGGASSAPGLKHVVLSDFSRGRDLMAAVRTNARGLGGFLREVWDFDGVGEIGRA